MPSRLIPLLGGVAAVLLLAASGAAAQPFGRGEGRHGHGGFSGPGRFLELTEEQQVAAHAIFEERRPQMQALHEQVRENEKLLRDSLESGSPDPTAVGELVIETHALRQESRAVGEESRKAFEGLLSPEQKRKLEMLKAARAAGGRKGSRGRMRRHGGGMGPRGMELDRE